MSNEIKIIGLNGIPLIKTGDNISDIIIKGLEDNKITLEDGDIIVIAQTIISKSRGRIINLKNIQPSKEAFKIFEKLKPKTKEHGIPLKSPELIQTILNESNQILKVEHVIITETIHGFVCANAGIDKSNVEGEYNVALLPKDSDEDAQIIRKDLKEKTNKEVAIIISDSFGRPFRIGAVGVAVGVAGIPSILDRRGEKDLFGYELQSTIVGQIDNLASAAQLIMGEANEGIPIIIIKGYSFNKSEKASINSIIRQKEIDLFRKKDDLINILKRRRSYKLEFEDREVDYGIIKECIDVARWAPNAHNNQCWRYIILEKNNEIRKNLIEHMNNKLIEDLKNDQKSEKYIEKKINKTKTNFLGAPYLVLLCLDTTDLEEYPDEDRNQKEFLMGVQSISASITSFLLILEMKNLAACWYCAPLFAEKIVKKELNLPDSFIPMAFITIGYPKRTVIPPSRKEVNEIIYKLK